MTCTCGHAREEHGHDPEYPGWTACTECTECIAYEEDFIDESLLTKVCGHDDAIVRNCPYQSDIKGNDQQRCKCCFDCSRVCAMGI